MVRGIDFLCFYLFYLVLQPISTLLFSHRCEWRWKDHKPKSRASTDLSFHCWHYRLCRCVVSYGLLCVRCWDSAEIPHDTSYYIALVIHAVYARMHTCRRIKRQIAPQQLMMGHLIQWSTVENRQLVPWTLFVVSGIISYLETKVHCVTNEKQDTLYQIPSSLPSCLSSSSLFLFQGIEQSGLDIQ